MAKERLVKDEIDCINCGGNSYQFKFRGFDRLHSKPGEFEILECVNCGLFTLRPKLLPQDVAAYYPDDYISYVKAIEDESGFINYIDRYWARERRVRQIVKRFKGPGRILDVGCATGILLSGMQRRGWECFGVEPDQNAAEYSHKRFGIEVFHGYLEQANYPNEFFDIVTLMDVLEHVNDPVSTLSEIYRIIKTGGHLIGTSPNGSSWEKSWFGPFWVGWDVPRHYHTFTLMTINQILMARGFDDVEIFSFTGRHGTFILSLKFWLGQWNGPRWLEKLIINVFGSFPMRILMLPGFYLSEWLNKSTILSFSARKD